MENLTLQNIDTFQLELGGSSEAGLALAIALMMFSVALSLRKEHFAFVRDAPRVFFAGVFCQIVLLPLLTLGLLYAVKPLPSVGLGMILVACCPGGSVSNMLVLLARGNIALSVSLTATSSICAAFITPISIVFWSSLYPPTSNLLTSIDFDVWSFLLQTGVVLALPLLAGMLCVKFAPRVALRLQNPLVALSSLLIALIIILTSIKYLDVFFTLGINLIALVVMHNALAFLCGNLTARLIRSDVAVRRSLTFEVGIQNSGLGIVILLTHLGGLGGAAAVAGLWGLWHILAGLMLVGVFRLTDRRSALL